MSRLPVIVGFGGYNAAGRSSFHHGFRRIVIETLDAQARQETLAGYGYQVLLKPEAIAWGLSCGLLLAWLVESVVLLIGAAAGVGRSRKVQQRHRL